MKSVSNYFGALKLIPNKKKIKVMYIRRNDGGGLPAIIIDSYPIESVDTYKYLGITIDVKLKLN